MDDKSRKRNNDTNTFIIRVQQHQNGTWQGEITWAEEEKSLHFRSIWEMVRLMEEGLAAQGVPPEEIPQWG